jgi:hypothetical protein
MLSKIGSKSSAAGGVKMGPIRPVSVVADTSKTTPSISGNQCRRWGQLLQPPCLELFATRDTREGRELRPPELSRIRRPRSLRSAIRRAWWQALPWKPCYSSRNATTGSTVAARREGT